MNEPHPINLSRRSVNSGISGVLKRAPFEHTRQRALCASTFSNQRLRLGCGLSPANQMQTNFRANMVRGSLPERYHRALLLPIIFRAMRSRKQSTRKAFNFGACATRREHGADWLVALARPSTHLRQTYFSIQARGGTRPAAEKGSGRAGLPGNDTAFFLGGAGIRPSRWACLRASLRARRIASLRSRVAFSDGFS